MNPVLEKTFVIVSQLRSFLGLLPYYRSFLFNVADTLKPLYQLLDNHMLWSWIKLHGKAFQKGKNMLCEALILELYDENKDIILRCDASDYGIGCVVSHFVTAHEKTIS